MKILDQPDAPGYYWWRKLPIHELWHLSKVDENMTARFFNGSQMSKETGFWGYWVKAEINEPTGATS